MKNYTKSILLLLLATTCSSITFAQEENQIDTTKSFDTVSLMEQINNLGNANDASGLYFIQLFNNANAVINLGLNPAITTKLTGSGSVTPGYRSIADEQANLNDLTTNIDTVAVDLNTLITTPNLDNLNSFYTDVDHLQNKCLIAYNDFGATYFDGTITSAYSVTMLRNVLHSLLQIITILKTQTQNQINLLS
ncbi:MAG: hypothetical protein ACXWL2_03630 [Candidatus Chromulinivorax sp.]